MSKYIKRLRVQEEDGTFSDKQIDYEALANKPIIPTKTSELTNDSGYITNAALQGLASEQYVENAIPETLPANGGIADKAKQDINGNSIIDTYATKEELSQYATIEYVESIIASMPTYANGEEMRF